MDRLRFGSPAAAPFGPSLLPALVGILIAGAASASGLLRLPFDTARLHYARAVQVGLVERSILASRDFEAWLGAIEALALGPLARRV